MGDVIEMFPKKAEDEPTSWAEFSDCGQYRWELGRKWDEHKPLVNFLMLNPSTADETNNDPTVSRCIERAKRMGYGGLIVTNIFALRSTDPRALNLHDDPVGSANNHVITRVAEMCDMVVCGWGNHGTLLDRGHEVLTMLLEYTEARVHYLRMTKKMQPQHPLYISYDIEPKRISA